LGTGRARSLIGKPTQQRRRTMNKIAAAIAIGIMTATSAAVLAQPPGWG
jgi:hypothetical protein